MDTNINMQNALFERLGIHLLLEQEVQVCESLQKSPLHEGLQLKTQ
jgi:hypothetical protein